MAKVLIVGAGMAGLAAAWRLRAANLRAAKKKNIEVRVCEATERIGGRAYTTEVAGEAMDWGCEALEAGKSGPIATLGLAAFGQQVERPKEPEQLYQIMDKYYCDIYRVVPADYKNKKGESDGDLRMQKNVEAMKEYIKSDPKALADYEPGDPLPADMPSDNVAYGVNAEPGPARLSALRSGYGPFSESACLGESSAYDRARSERRQEKAEAEAQQGEADEPVVFFQQGLGAVVADWAKENGLTECVEFKYPISYLCNDGEGVLVRPKLKGHQPERADYVIVTVASDLIARGSLEVEGLNDKHLEAFRDCPLGHYHKVVVSGLTGIECPAVNERIYITGPGMQDLYFLCRSRQGNYTMAHAAGDTAKVCNNDPTKAERMIFNALKILNPKVPSDLTYEDSSPAKYQHSTWHSDEYVGGAYSYGAVNKIEARQVLHGLRVGNILFAGEACSLTYYGQLTGAAETGLAAAETILNEIG